MVYLVNITSRAERDLSVLYEEVYTIHSAAARKWYEGLKRNILSLERRPLRGMVTKEDHELRQLLYGRKPHVYRVIYRVLEKQKQIVVLHIRHGARRPFVASDLR